MANLILTGTLAALFLVTGAAILLRRPASAALVHGEASAAHEDARDRGLAALSLGIVFLLTFGWTCITG